MVQSSLSGIGENVGMKTIDTEQGDFNNTRERQVYCNNALDEETRYWIEQDSKYFLHQSLSTPVMNILTRTEGAYIYDLQGRRYLDMHGNGVHNAGFSNPEVTAAVKKQLDAQLAFTPRRYSNIPTVKLAKKLAEIAPDDLNRSLFCPGGSQAIEMAIMLAKQVTGRWKTISFWDSYHGTGFQAASVGGEEHFTGGNGPMVPGAFHVEFPNYYRNPWGFETPDEVDEECLRQIKLILKRNPDIAAIVAEPVSATPVIPSLNYWKQIRALCDEYGIFLIFDEIIEGFGRTGKMFANEHFVTPDVMVLGKSLGGAILPFSGIVTKEKYNVLPNRSIGHYTHEKNPLCAAAALAEIEYLDRHELVKNAASLGGYLLQHLAKMKENYEIIGHVDGLGMHLGIDLVRDRASKTRASDVAEKIMYFCMERGLAFKIIESNIITLRPSLVLKPDQADFVLNTLEEAFKRFS